MRNPTEDEDPFTNDWPDENQQGGAGRAPIQQTAAPERWSSALERAPGWANGLGSDQMERLRGIYNGADPNGELQRMITAERARNPRADEGDDNVLRGLFGGSSGHAAGNTGGGGIDDYLQQMFQQQSSAYNDQKAWRDQMRANIMSSIENASRPVDENDPIIKKASQVYAGQTGDVLAQQKEQIAAARAGGGASSGSTDAAMTGSYENMAKARAGNTTGMMTQELQSRRQQLTSLLNTGAGVLTADENRALQDQLGTLDARIRQQQTSNQNNQFYDNMNYNGNLQQYLMQQWLLEHMGQAA